MCYRNFYGEYLGERLHHDMPVDVREMYAEEHEIVMRNIEVEELQGMYPEIFRIMYPMVRKTVAHHGHMRITRDMLDGMVSDIYENMEAEIMQEENQHRNGDVKNPNSKESEGTSFSVRLPIHQAQNTQEVHL